MVKFGYLLPIVLIPLSPYLLGCDRNPKTVPVSGRVVFNGVPLTFGSVMFQPNAGPVATGVIQADGTFSLSAFEPGDGALPGKHRVSVRCFASQRTDATAPDANREAAPGDSLIPERYAHVDTSGLVVEIAAPGADDIELQLVD